MFSQAAPDAWLGACSDTPAMWPEGPRVTLAQVRGAEGQVARRGRSPGLVPADPGGRGGGGI